MFLFLLFIPSQLQILCRLLSYQDLWSGQMSQYKLPSMLEKPITNEMRRDLNSV